MAPAISTVAVNPGIYAAATGGERRAGRFSKVRAVRNAADPSTTKRKKDYKTTKTAAARLTHCAPPSLTQASQRSSAPKVAPGGEFYPLYTPASRLPRRSRPNKASGSRPEPLDNLPGKIWIKKLTASPPPLPSIIRRPSRPLPPSRRGWTFRLVRNRPYLHRHRRRRERGPGARSRREPASRDALPGYPRPQLFRGSHHAQEDR